MSFTEKYRPKQFSDVVGQENAITTIKAHLDHNLETPILIHGYQGSGKSTLSRIIPTYLDCDFTESDMSEHGGKEAIESLLEKCTLIQDRHVMIFNECHSISSEKGWSLLLGILENPPENILFVLVTTQPHKVIPTVASRCFHVEVDKHSPSQIKGYLKDLVAKEGLEIDQITLKKIAYKSDSIRAALILLESIVNGVPLNEPNTMALNIKLLKHLLLGQTQQAVSQVNEYPRNTNWQNELIAMDNFLGELVMYRYECYLGSMNQTLSSFDSIQKNAIVTLMELLQLSLKNYFVNRQTLLFIAINTSNEVDKTQIDVPTNKKRLARKPKINKRNPKYKEVSVKDIK